ncbi:hypothetical protein [Magnetovibrio blakemorei]|uniref:Uncharacterized protein n=1 Tax=Magnetovibrio blakemorei TaxID=28181 RepID=A0A1E5QAY1_9PROT|nr:hypothetical protein [Magnetovibrio blakemorei]OEJ69192.1 hypothetical protein BEN30_03610 [Magnetovibrio blakemorei]
MSFVRPLGGLFVLLGFLMGGTNAFAQAAHDTSLLSEAERTHYRALLSKSTDSAERAQVKSEMNRLIQTRKIERRKAQDVTPKLLEQSEKKTRDVR